MDLVRDLAKGLNELAHRLFGSNSESRGEIRASIASLSSVFFSTSFLMWRSALVVACAAMSDPGDLKPSCAEVGVSYVNAAAWCR